MKYLIAIALALAACGDPCIVETTEEACPAGDCLPVEQGHPYGPCDPEVGCGGPESICYEPAPAGNVCAKTCTSDSDCGAVEYCTPDSAPATCSVWGWCVVACGAADGACPGGMVCDLDLEGAAGLGICTWPTVQKREAPDVPWPSVTIAGPVKSPLAIAEVLAGCFAEEVDYYSFQPQFFYGDKEPDGDDQQLAHLCVEWGAHLDVADCVRLGLLELGGTVTP